MGPLLVIDLVFIVGISIPLQHSPGHMFCAQCFGLCHSQGYGLWLIQSLIMAAFRLSQGIHTCALPRCYQRGFESIFLFPFSPLSSPNSLLSAIQLRLIWTGFEISQARMQHPWLAGKNLVYPGINQILKLTFSLNPPLVWRNYLY